MNVNGIYICVLSSTEPSWSFRIVYLFKKNKSSYISKALRLEIDILYILNYDPYTELTK